MPAIRTFSHNKRGMSAKIPLPRLATLALSGLAAFPATLPGADAPRPNIIFILTDDLGYGDLGAFYQNERRAKNNPALPAMLTPNLDKLAQDGIMLTRHYCPAPVSAPSRASLLTGVHQGRADLRDNQFDKPIPDNHTLATVLKKAGYATGVVGKWGVGGTNKNAPAHPMRRGFDTFFGIMAHLDAHFHYPKEARAAHPKSGAAFFDGTEDILKKTDKCYSTDLFTAYAKKWIIDRQRADAKQPFFLYLALTAPHAQLQVPAQAYPAGGGLNGGLQWLGADGKLINTADGVIDSWIHPDYANATWQNKEGKRVPWPEAEKRHATMIRRIDDAVADLRALLKDLKIDRNTLIVFTSDNGPHNEGGAGGKLAQNPRFFRSYGPLDGIKRDLWEGGVRVPTIAVWPAGIPAGTQSNRPAQFHDWMNTFARLAGLPEPAHSDGVSLVPTLTGSGKQGAGTVYSEYYFAGKTPENKDFAPAHRGATRRQMQMIFVNGYKAVRYNIKDEATPFRVYDTDKDPGELNDLAGKPGIPTQKEIVAKMLQTRRAGGDVKRPYDDDPVPASEVAGVAAGLNFRAYATPTPWVSTREDELPKTTGNVANLDLSLLPAGENTGAAFTGFLKIPAAGIYEFSIETDTGAIVRLHETQLIDADFGYKSGAPVFSGKIKLAAGFHPISIFYRHRAAAGTPALKLFWENAAGKKTEVPPDAFYSVFK